MIRYRYLVLCFVAHSLSALTTITVTLATDNKPGEQGESGDLRYALNQMNSLLQSTPDDCAIVFASPMTIQLNGILPIINNSSNAVNITIGNAGSVANVIIDGNSQYPAFFVPMGNVTIQNMQFQNLVARGGNGGNGISGGGGGMGAGPALFLPTTFLNGSYPQVTLRNVSIKNCTAQGGNGGSYLESYTGNEGGGGGGGFSGKGGSILASGETGGAGGGGFGGNGGNVVTSASDLSGGGGAGGGGIGSRATMGTLSNLGNGGSDQEAGFDGNGYGLLIVAGNGGNSLAGGNNAGGGGGGGANGGGGGGSQGTNGQLAQGSLPPGAGVIASGGNGGDGGGGGGGAIVKTGLTTYIDGHAGTGGYGGGGGGASGNGSYDNSYTLQGGSGGLGGGGGGGGVNGSGSTLASGGDSLGGGGGGGGGPSDGIVAPGGSDIGNLGGGSGGTGAESYGSGYGGGGGGGGSGLGGAIFIDRGLQLTIQALSGVPTLFNTTNTHVVAGLGGMSNAHATTPASDGSSLGDSIFLRSGSSLSLVAADATDILTVGDGVSFVDDTTFGAGGTNIFVSGTGTVVYEGTTDYAGTIIINNATFKVTGTINQASVSVCRNLSVSSQRGTLGGSGTVSGAVFANSGAIVPDAGATLTLGSLTLSHPIENSFPGSLVHGTITPQSSSLVSVTGSASLAGVLELDIDPAVQTGTYTILTSSGITGTFDSVQFVRSTPSYVLSYLPMGNPTYVQLEISTAATITPVTSVKGRQRKNHFGFHFELYNELSWQRSTSDGVAGYYIYRDGTLVAQLDSSTLGYKDRNRPRGVSTTYSIIAFDLSGNKSEAATITIS